MKKERLHIVTIYVGVFTALMVVCSQFLHFQIAQYAKKEVKTEKQEKKQDNQTSDESYFTISSFSQPPSAHVETDQKSCCLFDILFEKSKEEESTDRIPFSFTKFFQTLFRVIIAPNAP